MEKLFSSKEIHDYIINNIEGSPGTIVRDTTGKFKISRQAVNRHMQKLQKEGLVMSKGATHNKKYFLKSISEKHYKIKVNKKLEEDKVWRQYIYPLLEGIKTNVMDICLYGFTEMVNNVIDHSAAESLVVKCCRSPGRIVLTVKDNGIGIINNITRKMKLDDYQDAILELVKGKLTTDPKHHTGEGIFFTIRMFDQFSIISENLCFTSFRNEVWSLERNTRKSKGTTVSLTINPNSNKTPKEIFDRYTAREDGYGFTRTQVPVILAAHKGEILVSRSQAKRLLKRFDCFEEVVLDFAGINFIGQAFADEIFRVFVTNNPAIKITWINTSPDVEKMIKRATADSAR